ncbi:hypothetical protein DL96DRAFT_1713276 [Flagelloscypha sp. PMI_526]|nr:hypothetical protein DL96DRAFT_1713276 [Flagelloscypha sp. PMI_526]
MPWSETFMNSVMKSNVSTPEPTASTSSVSLQERSMRLFLRIHAPILLGSHVIRRIYECIWWNTNWKDYRRLIENRILSHGPRTSRTPYNGAEIGLGVGIVTLLPLVHAASRVAIVGAGAGGFSASLDQEAKCSAIRFGVNIDIDTFKKSHYNGGRSTGVIHPYDDTSYQPVELGASIFVEANKNLCQVADKFGHIRGPNEGDSEIYDVGI